MKIEAQFTHDKVKHDQENDVHLVVSLTAPKNDWQKKRPPVCIIPVIDISSSMQGQKLDYAKKSVDKLVEHLQPGDFCGLVIFSDTVTTVAKPAEMTQNAKDRLRAKVGELVVEGCTNFSGGMCEALEHANRGDFPQGMLVRVIMFTDGQANRGIATKRAELLPLLEKFLGSATLSAFGYGSDADQELLADLAKKGKGNYAFIKNPDDALSAFAKELGGLLSTYAQSLVVEVDPHNGHKIVEVVSDVDVEPNGTAGTPGKGVRIKIPEILAEETRHLVISFKLSEQSQALPRAMNVADVNVSYELLGESGERTKKTEELKAKVWFVKDGEQQDKPTPEVDKLVGLAQLVQTQSAAEQYANRGDYAGAQKLMASVEHGFHRRGLMPQAMAAQGLRARMGSATSYGASAGYRSSLKGGVTRSAGTSGMDADARVELSAMGVSCDTSAQANMVQNFVGGMNMDATTGSGAPSAPVVPPVINPANKKEKADKGLAKKRSTARW